MKAEKVNAKRFIEILSGKELMKVVGGYCPDDDDRKCYKCVCSNFEEYYRAYSSDCSSVCDPMAVISITRC